MADRATIRVEHLSKLYPGATRPAVDDISFVAQAGEVLGFVGPNGAGKTTTMKMLTSILAPTDGRAEVAGFDVVTQSVESRSRIGYLPEDTPLYRDMAVYEYLEWVARMRNLPPSSVRARIKTVTEQCAVAHRLGDLIGQLSKGYRQRVGLAQAILHDPEVLILDEPTSGLDPNQIVEIRNVIKEYGRNKTVIFSTHILSEVQATCSRVIVISDGKLVADARPRELEHVLDKSRGMQLRVELTGAVAEGRAALEKVPGVIAVSATGDGEGRFLVTAKPGDDPRGEITAATGAAGARLVEMSSNTSLEEVFRAITLKQVTAPMSEGSSSHA